MQQVTSIEQLQVLSAEIRAKRQGFVTNFYLDEEKHQVWIERGDCYAANIGSTLFIVKKSHTFWNVFYCSTTIEQLSSDLQLFTSQQPQQALVFDVVGRETQCLPMVDMFKHNGYTEATSLVRMSRMTEPMTYTPDHSVRKAKKSEVSNIHTLLHQYFNEQTEQIPYLEELEKYADQGHILVCEEMEKIVGFLIYELNATTLYLRYWFALPAFRDKKVGSRLLRRFFEEGKETKRQLFWVIRTNENAIKRYKHYGFQEENLYDYVMTNQ